MDTISQLQALATTVAMLKKEIAELRDRIANLPVRFGVDGPDVLIARITVKASQGHGRYKAKLVTTTVSAGVATNDPQGEERDLYNPNWEGPAGTVFLNVGDEVSVIVRGRDLIAIDGHPRGYF